MLATKPLKTRLLPKHFPPSFPALPCAHRDFSRLVPNEGTAASADGKDRGFCSVGHHWQWAAGTEDAAATNRHSRPQYIVHSPISPSQVDRVAPPRRPGSAREGPGARGQFASHLQSGSRDQNSIAKNRHPGRAEKGQTVGFTWDVLYICSVSKSQFRPR